MKFDLQSTIDLWDETYSKLDKSIQHLSTNNVKRIFENLYDREQKMSDYIRELETFNTELVKRTKWWNYWIKNREIFQLVLTTLGTIAAIIAAIK